MMFNKNRYYSLSTVRNVQERLVQLTDDEARLDNAANGFWGGRFQLTYCDVAIFNPNAASYRKNKIASCYGNQEQEKKRKYEELVSAVELASFTSIILSCTCGCSKITTTFLKRLASLLSQEKHTLQPNTQLDLLPP